MTDHYGIPEVLHWMRISNDNILVNTVKKKLGP